MTHMLWRRTATSEVTASTPDSVTLESVEVTDQQLESGSAATSGAVAEPHHTHHLRESVTAALAHIPHHLPEPHQHYPPLHPSYLESTRMLRELRHL